MKKKSHIKLTKKGIAVIASFTAVVTAGIIAVKFIGNDSKYIEVTQTQVAVSATSERTQDTAPTQPAVQTQGQATTQTTVQTQGQATTQTTVQTQGQATTQTTQLTQVNTIKQAPTVKEKRVTTNVDAKAVLADPSLSICIKTKSTSFNKEGAKVLEPQIDLRLVSKDGKINTWTSINNNGDLYNATGQRFKGVGDGTFYDVNGVIYNVVQVSKVVK